jgi:hypothetical protein
VLVVVLVVMFCQQWQIGVYVASLLFNGAKKQRIGSLSGSRCFVSVAGGCECGSYCFTGSANSHHVSVSIFQCSTLLSVSHSPPTRETKAIA